MTKPSTPTFVPLAELAADLGVDPATLRQRIARGKLRARKVGPLWFVEQSEADRVIAAGRGTSGVARGATA